LLKREGQSLKQQGQRRVKTEKLKQNKLLLEVEGERRES